MPSKLRRALDMVKDHTKLSFAIISGSSDIQLSVLRATSHDPSPTDDQALANLLVLVSSSPEIAVQAIRRRLSRTRNWIVAVKCLSLVSRAVSDAGPEFRHVALSTADGRLLDLSSFRDKSWDFTAFVRTFALYLDARLAVTASGTLTRHPRLRPVFSTLNPPALADRIGQWQFLLQRAIGTRPTGQARASRLIRIAFHSVVRESFDLYRDISDGISFLIDNFPSLSSRLKVRIFQAGRDSVKQFEEVEVFYEGCRKMGIGRPFECPSSVRKISASLFDKLERIIQDGEEGSFLSPPQPQSWELALIQSINEFGFRSRGEESSEGGCPSSLQNPFLRAASGKSLMKKDCRFTESEEEDPFEQLVRRQRPPLIKEAPQ